VFVLTDSARLRHDEMHWKLGLVVAGTSQTTPQRAFCLATAQRHWPAAHRNVHCSFHKHSHCSQKCNTASRRPYTEPACW